MNYIYWYLPEIQSNNISKALRLKSPDLLMEVLEDFESEIICKKCGKPIYFSGRAKLMEVRIKIAKREVLSMLMELDKLIGEKIWRNIQK